MNEFRGRGGPIPIMIEAKEDDSGEIDQFDEDEESYLYSDVGTTISPHLYSHSASLISKHSNDTRTTFDPSSLEDKGLSETSKDYPAEDGHYPQGSGKETLDV